MLKNESQKKHRVACIFAIALATFLVCTLPAFANDGKVTFINNAQAAGRIDATVTYTDDDGSNRSNCTVTGTVTHPVGTDKKIKAEQLAKDITDQCVNVSATDNGNGTVTVTSADGKTITEIDVKDRTKQKKTINPKNLNDDKKRLALLVSGFGMGGFATISMDECGSFAAVPTAGKTGAQVAMELVDSLWNCDEASGSTIDFIDWGGDMGEIRFSGLSNENSVITFDAGGEMSTLEDIVIFGVEGSDADQPPVEEPF